MSQPLLLLPLLVLLVLLLLLLPLLLLLLVVVLLRESDRGSHRPDGIRVLAYMVARSMLSQAGNQQAIRQRNGVCVHKATSSWPCQ
jgi:hypothetical protein